MFEVELGWTAVPKSPFVSTPICCNHLGNQQAHDLIATSMTSSGSSGLRHVFVRTLRRSAPLRSKTDGIVFGSGRLLVSDPCSGDIEPRRNRGWRWRKEHKPKRPECLDQFHRILTCCLPGLLWECFCCLLGYGVHVESQHMDEPPNRGRL